MLGFKYFFILYWLLPLKNFHLSILLFGTLVSFWNFQKKKKSNLFAAYCNYEYMHLRYVTF